MRAAVHGMTMKIGEVLIRAKIKEKEEAKREFLKAKAEGKTASLLERKRPNVFKMSVVHVMPGDKIDIELHYSELLVPTQGTYEFVYPTVVGPRFSDTLEADAGHLAQFHRHHRRLCRRRQGDVRLHPGES